MTERVGPQEAIRDAHLQSKQFATTALTSIDAAQRIVEEFSQKNDFSSTAISQFCAALKETLGDQLTEEFKRCNEEMQRLGKQVERKSKQDSVASFFASNNTTKHVVDGQKRCRINYAIAEYFYRRGFNEIADTFCQEVGLREEDTRLRTKFENLNQILQKLRQFDIQDALQWCDDNQPIAEHASFLLHKLLFVKGYSDCTAVADPVEQSRAVVRLVHTGKKIFAAYAETPQYRNCIQQLMTSVLWLKQRQPQPAARSPYALLTNLQQCQQEATHEFAHTYCQHNGMTEYSPLEVAVGAGSIAIPKLVKVLALIRDKKIEWTQSNELPIEVELPVEYQNFHSVFTCPVLKVQGSEENPPMCLPCGHIICKDALLKLSKGQPHLKFKCPYCPAECSSVDAIVVHL